MNRLIDARVWIAAVLISWTLFAKAGELPVQDRYDAFIRALDTHSSLSRQDRVDALGAVFDALFPVAESGNLEALEDEDLSTSFLAAANAVRMIGRVDDVRRAELAFDALLSRGIASESQFSYMHGAYIQTRMLEEARRFQARHPAAGLTPVPALRESERLAPGKPTELVVGVDGNTLFRRTVDISAPVQAVVVAHPGCRYSREAMLAIEGDPVLAGAMKASKWLMPPAFGFDTEMVQRWNRSHPETTLAHAYKVEEWPQLDYWGTPTFYFFKDGVLEAKVTGWPKGGRRDELLAALREVGMLPVEE